MTKEQLNMLIEQFLQATGMPATRFGINALGDPSLVSQIRKGRRLWPETQDKVIRYIEQHQKQ